MDTHVDEQGCCVLRAVSLFCRKSVPLEWNGARNPPVISIINHLRHHLHLQLALAQPTGLRVWSRHHPHEQPLFAPPSPPASALVHPLLPPPLRHVPTCPSISRVTVSLVPLSLLLVPPLRIPFVTPFAT